MSKLNFTTQWSHTGQVGEFLSKLFESRGNSTWLSFNKIALTSSPSSTSIHQCWGYKNSFVRHSYKISLLTEFFKRTTEPKDITGLWCIYCVNKHLWIWVSLNSTWYRVNDLSVWATCVLIQKSPLVSVIPTEVSRESHTQIREGENLRKHLVQVILVCVWGRGWRVNSTGSILILHTVSLPASSPPSPLKCGPWTQHQ